MKSQLRINSKSGSSPTEGDLRYLELQLHALRVDPKRGHRALKLALQQLDVKPQVTNADETSSDVWFLKAPAMAAGLAVFVLLVVGGGFLISNSQSSSVVSSQTQPNGTVQNATNTQISDAQNDQTAANNDGVVINTANARLQSASTIGESINASGF